MKQLLPPLVQGKQSYVNNRKVFEANKFIAALEYGRVVAFSKSFDNLIGKCCIR